MPSIYGKWREKKYAILLTVNTAIPKVLLFVWIFELPLSSQWSRQFCESNENVIRNFNCEIFKWDARESSYRLSSSSSPSSSYGGSRSSSHWVESLKWWQIETTFSFLIALYLFCSPFLTHFKDTQHANVVCMLSVFVCRQKGVKCPN